MKRPLPHPLDRKCRDKGLGLVEFARKLGVSPYTVGSWKKGRNRPQPRHIRLVAEFFGISTEEANELLDPVQK